MNRSTGILGTVVLAAVLAGCGGGGDSSSGKAAPDNITLTLNLHDAGSLDALFNEGYGLCTTTNLGEALDVSMANPGMSAKDLRALLPKTKVTVADAAGKTVAVKTLPKTGGDFSKSSGCKWPLDVDVAPSDFYSVTVEHGDFSKTEKFKRTERGVDFVF